MNTTFRVTGVLPTATSTVEFDNATAIVEYLANKKWAADVLVEPARKQYNYRFLDGDVYSSWTTVNAPTSGETLSYRNADNNLDLFGDLLGLERLSEEANHNYKERLLDVYRNRGGPNYDGLLNGLLRDLGLNNKRDVLNVFAAENARTGGRWEDVVVRFSYAYGHVSSPAFRVWREEAYVKPFTLTVTPSRVVLSDLAIETADGKTYFPDLYRLNARTGTIEFLDPAMEDAKIFMSYRYEVRVAKQGKTVQEFADALIAVETPSGDQLLEVEVLPDYEDFSATGIGITAQFNPLVREIDPLGVVKTGVDVRWSPVGLCLLSDPFYQQENEDADGGLWNTKISAYADSVRTMGKATWGTAVADESLWAPKDFPMMGGQHIPTLFDVKLGFYRDPITGASYDKWRFLYSDSTLATGVLIQYNGLLGSDFRSGVGGQFDLKVVVDNQVHEDGESEGEHIVSDTEASTTVPDGSTATTGGVELP